MGASSFTNQGNDGIGDWDVSAVTSMKEMFYGATKFNADVSQWDVSKVTTMELIFGNAESFNCDIGNWQLLRAKTTDYMFYGATSFDQVSVGLLRSPRFSAKQRLAQTFRPSVRPRRAWRNGTSAP